MSIRDIDFPHLCIKYFLAFSTIGLIGCIFYVTVAFLNYEAASVEDKYELPECKSHENRVI